MKRGTLLGLGLGVGFAWLGVWGCVWIWWVFVNLGLVWGVVLVVFSPFSVFVPWYAGFAHGDWWLFIGYLAWIPLIGASATAE